MVTLNYCTVIRGLTAPFKKGEQFFISLQHKLNMELDLQSLFGLLCTAVLIG
jgi:hypothetical protein